MTARPGEINLLPKNKWEKGWIGRLLFWILNVGRYVVVFTELIVVSAFLFRFGLDKKLSDLNLEIDQKKTVVESFGDLENKFRRLQDQFKQINEVEASSLKANQVLNTISQITPIDTVYSVININPETVVLEGQTLSSAGLATLLAKSQGEPMFLDVTLETVSSEKSNSGAIVFRLALTLKEKAKSK